MHDPSTVAFEIKRPWPQRWSGSIPGWYWPSMLTVWHEDPESDGTDDSCGWSRPKLNEKDRKLAEELADWDERHPYYFAQPLKVHAGEYNYPEVSPGDATALCVEAIRNIAWRLDRRQMDTKLFMKAYTMGSSEFDNLQAFFSGAAPNDMTHEDRVQKFCCLIRNYKSFSRKWW